MLELNRISAGYGRRTVLDNVSASFAKGKLISVIGVNGCGKSTLLKAALGMLPISKGEIKIDGAELHAMTRKEIAKKISYLPQGKNAPDMTVEQMVLHGRFPYLSYPRRYSSHDQEVTKKAMDAVGITDLAHKPLDTLSGGMKQNTYIAMALAQDTDYILFDEPTTYLDISHQIKLMNLLRKLADNGKGIVTVMHDLPMAFNYSDEILVIENGTSRVQATPREICVTSVIKEVFDVQISLFDDKRYGYVDT